MAYQVRDPERARELLALQPGLTQRQIAEAAGVSTALISLVLSGDRTCRYEVAFTISRLLRAGDVFTVQIPLPRNANAARQGAISEGRTA